MAKRKTSGEGRKAPASRVRREPPSRPALGDSASGLPGLIREHDVWLGEAELGPDAESRESAAAVARLLLAAIQAIQSDDKPALDELDETARRQLGQASARARTTDADKLRSLMAAWLQSRWRQQTMRPATDALRKFVARRQAQFRKAGTNTVVSVAKEFEPAAAALDLAESFVSMIACSGELPFLAEKFRTLGSIPAGPIFGSPREGALGALVRRVAEQFRKLWDKDEIGRRRRESYQPDPEEYVCGGLAAMGYPAEQASAFFKHLQMRARREVAPSDKTEH